MPAIGGSQAATAGLRLRSADTVTVPCPVIWRTSDKSSSAHSRPEGRTAPSEHVPSGRDDKRETHSGACVSDEE
jgi:hypothetical protein